MNSPKNIKFRGASKPFAPEIAADLIYETNPPIFKCLLNDNRDLARRITTACWQAEDGFWTHKSAYTATSDGKLVGIEIGYPGEEEGVRSSSAFVRIASILSATETDIYLDRAPFVELLLPEPDPQAWYVGTLSITAEARGRGVGKQLLADAFNRASEKGFSKVQLDVYATNPAVDFYRGMGMEVLLESHVPKLDREFGVPAHYRMTIDV